nr:Uncharacterised protein [Streptococcus thermophilus]
MTQPEVTPVQTGRNRLPLFALILCILAVLVLVVAVAFVALRGAAGTPTEDDGEQAAQPLASPDAAGITDETVDRTFTDGTVTRCDFGEDFYAASGMTKVYEPEKHCLGRYEVEEGLVAVGISITSSGLTFLEEQEELDLPGLDGWIQGTPAINFGPECEMRSSRPELEAVELSTYGTCEPLYPLAKQLNNLANHASGDHTYIDPEPTRMSIAPEDFKTQLNEAVAVGEAIELESAAVEGATMTLTEVYEEKRRLPGDDYDAVMLCARTVFNAGRFTTPDAAELTFPTLTARYPDGHIADLELESNAEFKEGTDTELTFCGRRRATIEEADYVVASSDLLFGDPAGGWRLTMTAD